MVTCSFHWNFKNQPLKLLFAKQEVDCGPEQTLQVKGLPVWRPLESQLLIVFLYLLNSVILSLYRMGCRCGNRRLESLSVASWLRATYIPMVVISSLIDKAGRGWEMQSHPRQGRSERMDGEERILEVSCFSSLTKPNQTEKLTFLNAIVTN